MSTNTAPAGFTPDYFVNEFAKEPVPDFTCYTGPDIERPGYKVQTMWTPERGLQLWIDHHQDNAFTVTEVQDLISTLSGVLKDHA